MAGIGPQRIEGEMKKNETPAGLFAIAWAGQQTGDRALVRTAKQLLKTRFGVRISFAHKQQPTANRKGGGR